MLNYFVVRVPVGQALGFGVVISKSVDHDNNTTSLVCDSTSGSYRVLLRKTTNGAPVDGDGVVFKDRRAALRYSKKITGWA